MQLFAQKILNSCTVIKREGTMNGSFERLMNSLLGLWDILLFHTPHTKFIN